VAINPDDPGLDPAYVQLHRQLVQGRAEVLTSPSDEFRAVAAYLAQLPNPE
jgi:hypothetical protein